MRKVILSCLTICAAMTVGEAQAHPNHHSHGHYKDRGSHRHCHYHSRRDVEHCHWHTHRGPGKGHHGDKWMHPVWHPHYFDYHIQFRY